MSRTKMIVNSLRKAIQNVFALDGKRTWCEYGYIENPQFSDLYAAYRRNGVGGGSIVKTNNKIWSSYPELYRGSPSEEDQHQDEYERKLNEIFNDKLWKEFKEADKRRMIGRWSALVLYFNDGDQVSMGDPVVNGSQLRFVKAAWANALSVSKYDKDGVPAQWQYTRPPINGQPKQIVNIHPDRLFIIGDNTTDGEAFHERGLNNLTNIEKVEGGSAESYRKNAARQLHINYDPEIDVEPFPDGESGENTSVKKEMEKSGKDLNQGNDTFLITQGATSNQLVSQVPDPTPTFMINVQSYCASLPIDMSAKILLGNQTGERSSTEDLKQFNASCQAYRDSELSPTIIALVEKLMQLGSISLDKVGVTWSDLTTATQTERLEVSKSMSEINRESIMTGGDPIFSEEEVRSAAGYDTATDNSSL